MQNKLESAIKRTMNAVKPVSKQATQSFARILATVPPIDAKNLHSAKKGITNAVKPVSKPTNKRFLPYIGNGTSYLRKIIS